MKTIIQLIESCQSKIISLEQMIPVQTNTRKLAELDENISNPKIWNDPKAAASLMKDRQKIADLLNRFSYFKDQTALYQEFLSSDPEELEAMYTQIVQLEKSMGELEFQQMLSEPTDDSPAILNISAGAGGTEAKNWTQILCRMYMRYAASMGWNVEVLDEKQSEEYSDICLDSISLCIDGKFAYGYLKNENGVHRLIRNSPFNSGDARHTSFAAVSVLPDIEDTIDIKIEEKDLEIQATKSSGSGGQSVNTTDSCILLKHLPSGILIRSRTEKSQHQNRAKAMKLLKAKLYQLELDKKNEIKNKQLAQQSNTAFGSQIRTITMTPYSLYKNHITNYETNQVEVILDGQLQEMIMDNLRNIKS